VQLPAETDAFFASVASGQEPEQTLVFFNHNRPGEGYPNEKGTLTLQLVTPPSGRNYGLADPLVAREMQRVEESLGLPHPVSPAILRAQAALAVAGRRFGASRRRRPCRT
jgi:hypothetical protein